VNHSELADDTELVLAAAALGISRERAQRMVLTGRLQGYRRDGKWYVGRQSLQEELDRRLSSRGTRDRA
jgi:hypothetical protein